MNMKLNSTLNVTIFSLCSNINKFKWKKLNYCNSLVWQQRKYIQKVKSVMVTTTENHKNSIV